MAWLYQRPDSKRWWIGWRQGGRQFLKSTKTSDRKAAEAQLARMEAMFALQCANVLTTEVFESLTGKSLPTRTVEKALTEWVAEARVSTKPKTVEKYSQAHREFLTWLQANARAGMVGDVSRDDVQGFLNHKRTTVSAATVNMARKCLSVFFRRCIVAGYLRDNPMLGVKLAKVPKAEQRVRRPFKLAEMQSLYAAAPDDFWRYLVMAGFFTGLRLGDLVTIPIGAVDFKAGCIKLLSRKTNTPMHIPLAAPLLRLLVKLRRKNAKPIDPLWPEHAKRYEKLGPGWFSNQFYEKLLVPAGLAAARSHKPQPGVTKGRRRVSEVSFHCFRHSYVSTLAAMGHNQQVVKALAGHSSDEINDLYTKVPVEVMAKAVALLPDITKEAK